MSESVKAVLAVLFILATLAAVVLWATGDARTLGSWALRIGVTAVALALLGVLAWAQYRRDKAPDFLRLIFRYYFERDGFAFAIRAIARDGVCVMQMWFQNRYEGPCRARVALRPSQGFFLTRSRIQGLAFGVQCPEAGFGVVEVPLGVPVEYQGKKQTFDVGASARYPEGSGKLLRYREGARVGPVEFSTVAGRLLTLAQVATGSIPLGSGPSSHTLVLPEGVAEAVPDYSPVTTSIYWQLGDPVPDGIPGFAHSPTAEQP